MATELAYEVIYKAQGFVPVADTKAGDTDGTAGSDNGDSGKAKAVKRSRKSE